MARKPHAPHDQATVQQVVDAALALAALRPWHRIPLADIAAEAGLSVGDLYRLFPSRQAILMALLREIDLKALSRPVESDALPRDRLFEALMHRFDALAPLKPGIAEALGALRKGHAGGLPAAALAAVQGSFALGWYLESAGISVEGVRGLARVKLAALAYLAAFRVWLRDDSADLAGTMAALDRALGRVWPLFGLAAPRPAEAA